MADANRVQVYQQLKSIRMSDAQRREAIAYLERADTLADLIHGTARSLRGAATTLARGFRSIGQRLTNRWRNAMLLAGRRYHASQTLPTHQTLNHKEPR
jgi:hypothetical protein